jgi:methionine-rich copper-binding protein CopC
VHRLPAAYAGFMRWLVSVMAAVALVAMPASGAFAHAGLAFSNPEDGAALEVAPEEVVLTFTEELLSDLVEISVLDADDNPVVVTELPQTPPPGTDVKVPWPADLPPGEYSVAFRVVSADGHPVTGRVTFSYAQQREVVEESTPSDAPSETPKVAEPTTEPEVTSEQTPEATTEATFEEIVPAEDEPNDSLIGPLLIAAAVIVGIGVIVSIVMLARSRQ